MAFLAKTSHLNDFLVSNPNPAVAQPGATLADLSVPVDPTAPVQSGEEQDSSTQDSALREALLEEEPLGFDFSFRPLVETAREEEEQQQEGFTQVYHERPEFKFRDDADTDVDEAEYREWKKHEDETILEGIKRDALPIIGSIVGPLLAQSTPQGRAATGFWYLLRMVIGGMAGMAGGEGLKMTQQAVTGDPDAPEDLYDVFARLGTYGTMGAVSELGGQLLARGITLVPGYLRHARDKIAAPFARGSVDRQTNAIVSDLYGQVDQSLTAAQRGVILHDVLRGGRGVANEVADDIYARVDYVLTQTPTRQYIGIDPATGRAVYEMVPGSTLDLGTATEPLVEALGSILKGRGLSAQARDIATPIIARIEERLSGPVTFSEAHRLVAQDLEHTKIMLQELLKGAGNFADKGIYKQILAEIDHAQKSIRKIMLETAESAGPDALRLAKEADEILKNPGGVNSQFMQEALTKDPSGAGAHILANGSRQDVAEMRRALELAKRKNPDLDLNAIWSDMTSGYFSNALKASTDPKTGKLSVDKMLQWLTNKEHVANMRIALGDKFESVHEGLRRSVEAAKNNPAQVAFAPIQRLPGVIAEVTGIPMSGIAGMAGGLATAVGIIDPATLLKTMGTYLGIRLTPGTIAGIYKGGEKGVQFVARVHEAMHTYINQVMGKLLSNPEAVQLITRAMREGDSGPNAARLATRIAALAAEEGLDLESHLKEQLQGIVKEFELVYGDSEDPSDRPTFRSDDAPETPTGDRPNFRFQDDPEDTTQEGFNQASYTQPRDSQGQPRRSETPSSRVYVQTSSYDTPEAQEWVDKYQRANPGVSRSDAIKEGQRQGKVDKRYKDPALGIRNNNPGNIRVSNTNWQGKDPNGRGGFETFETPEHGIRAMAVNLQTYSRVHGLSTVDQIISRWAPPNENRTGSYINTVAKRMGVKPNERLNLNDPKVMRELIKAIIYVENGSNPYDDKLVDKGIRMASK